VGAGCAGEMEGLAERGEAVEAGEEGQPGQVVGEEGEEGGWFLVAGPEL
jgi:hypothetical protein